MCKPAFITNGFPGMKLQPHSTIIRQTEAVEFLVLFPAQIEGDIAT